ncbi:hypothetical protein [Methanococcoides alaskense]|uniref:Uncharacterized protein n=1 Tax=Methanococcoides alaskense TaxID=325778 RepID=A0AA90TZG9_9EURY|nr:hypothetical protein [Methanococcoides alaskense]MDA0524659.1 hypothetical protein [Methanococcoides alaskense]MDR6222414.1 hypothetical protein [Methanococcoides alaskense]
MLTSIISTTRTAASTALSMITDIGLSEYGVLVVIALIILLYAKEILSASKYWNKSVRAYLNGIMIPLLIAFAWIITLKVIEII